jgi:hypothetical protein
MYMCDSYVPTYVPEFSTFGGQRFGETVEHGVD